MAPRLLPGASAWSWHQWTGLGRACGPWEWTWSPAGCSLARAQTKEAEPAGRRGARPSSCPACWEGHRDRPVGQGRWQTHSADPGGQPLDLAWPGRTRHCHSVSCRCIWAGRSVLAVACSQRPGLLGGRSGVMWPLQVADPWCLEQGCCPPLGRPRGSALPGSVGTGFPAAPHPGSRPSAAAFTCPRPPPATLRACDPPGQTHGFPGCDSSQPRSRAGDLRPLPLCNATVTHGRDPWLQARDQGVPKVT